MRVLVTGASGFLGGHLVEMFQKAGHQVRAFVRRTSRTDLLEHLGTEIVKGDMKDPASLRRAVEGMEAVVHAASTMAGVPQEYQEATVRGTAALLAAAEEAGVRRFVYVSSIAVCKMRAPRRLGPITEATPYEDEPLFLSNYTRSKIGAEAAALEAARRGRTDVVILRPGIMYGPRGRWNLTRMGYGLGPNVYLLIGGGWNPLPVCYVRNFARAVLLATEAADLNGRVFNVVDDQVFTAREYLRRLKKEVRPGLKIVRFPYLLARGLAWLGGIGFGLIGKPCPLRPAHLISCARRLTYSNEEAKRVLGWRPEVGKEEALAETMRDYAARARVSRRSDLGRLGRVVTGEPPVTACVVGCGMIAREHLKILRRMQNARVAAVCDLDAGAAGDLARTFGVRGVYADVVEMLEAERPRMLHVLTPPQSHLRVAEEALRRGCNVLIEKPMTVDAAEARRIAELARRYGAQACVGHNKVYDPVVVQARRLVESGALGQLLWVEAYCGFDLGSNPASRYMVPGSERHWTFRLPGGLFQNLAPHPLSLALDFLGPPVRVQAHARYGRVLPHAATDELRVLLETEDASGLVTVSIAASPRLEYLNLYGTRAVVQVDLLNQWVVVQKVLRGVPKPISRAMMNLRQGLTLIGGTLSGMGRVLMKRWSPYRGMEILIREYYASIQERRPPPVSLEEGVRVMEVMDQVWDQVGSHRCGGPATEDRRAERPVKVGEAR